MDTDRHLFESAFDFTACESSILLNQKPAKVCIDDITYTGSGEVRMGLASRASIYLYGTFQDVPAKDMMGVMFGSKEISSFHINEQDVEGFNVKIGGNVDERVMTVKWCPKSEPIYGVGGASTKMNQVVFHLFNFKDILAKHRSSEKKGAGICSIGHVDLSCNGWKVQLRSLVETSDNFKKLKSEGGYQLTHIGCLRKNNGTVLSGKETNKILNALRFFISFAKGAWCEPICAVGFNASDNRVWEYWSSPRDIWHPPPSWFDPHHCEQLIELFPYFMTKWEKEDWQEALRETIYWYLNANNSSRGIDAGIILTQAAIERLSYEYTVKAKRLATVNGFKDLWASDKFRLLFSSLGIPIDISSQTPELQKLAKKFKWLDAPHALTEVRNSLVHPEHKRRGQFDSAFYEAWNLGLWCLELSILRICEYSGSYSNRLVGDKYVGAVENVPWAN